MKVGTFGGGTILGLCNGNLGSGDATIIHVFAIRRGYDDNANGELHDIVFTRNDYKVTMSKSNNNTIVLRTPVGNSTILLIGTKL